MDMKPTMILRELVLVGGGHSHVHVIKMLGMKPISGLRVTLITRDIETPYSGMLPGYVANIYHRDECHIDLVRLCSFANVRLIHVEACGIDTSRKLVLLRGGRPAIRYDVLSIDIGICPKPLPHSFGATGVTTVTAVKPIDSFASRWDHVLTDLLSRPSAQNNNAGSRQYYIAIIGGGAGGVELTFAIHYRLRRELLARGKDPDSITLSLMTRGSKLLSSHSSTAGEKCYDLLMSRGIMVYLGAEIVDTAKTASGGGVFNETCYLVSADGRQFQCNQAFWCIEAAAQSWVKETGLATTSEGFIRVKSTLESVNVAGVFASGDVCHMETHPRPKAGVFAVRAGPPLLNNLRRCLFDLPLEPWEPQTEFLGIIGTYCNYSLENELTNIHTQTRERQLNGNDQSLSAVASKGQLCLEGADLWTLKDRIDRQWMAGYTLLPEMNTGMGATTASSTPSQTAPAVDISELIPPIFRTEIKPLRSSDLDPPMNALSDSTALSSDLKGLLEKASMRCGGCGSKVGSQVLTRALKRVLKASALGHTDTVLTAARATATPAAATPTATRSRLGDDDAALLVPPRPPLLAVHTIDFFKSCHNDPYVFGQISANHSLSDIFAMNGRATSALALCVVPLGPDNQVEDTLVHMLSGCMAILQREGCELVGGHTTEGSELSFGLSVNGEVHPDEVLRKGPLISGHKLILTKPIGTGVLLAANMRGKARASWIQEAVEMMLQSNKQAASILQAQSCNACTDVTGFGLLGHLLEMIKFGNASDEPDEKIDTVFTSIDDTSTLDESSSKVKVKLYLDKLPLLKGALECVTAGISSSLLPQNIRSAQALLNADLENVSDTFQLIFDPQTSGGLLGSVPEDKADAAVAELREAGYSNCAIIGEIYDCMDNNSNLYTLGGRSKYGLVQIF